MAMTLKDCQTALKGNGYQAIIPMTGDTPGDPRALPKTWTGGSASWRDDDQLEAFRQICVRPSKRRWFCAVVWRVIVKESTFSLKKAQKSLGFGSNKQVQAIIPMVGSTAGDPHTLPKEWEGGSMWWLNYYQINDMQDFCHRYAETFGIPDMETF